MTPAELVELILRLAGDNPSWGYTRIQGELRRLGLSWSETLTTTGAEVAELTGLLSDDRFPAGTRFIIRRERPHPGAQLDLFDTVEGMRHQLIATDSPVGTGPIACTQALLLDGELAKAEPKKLRYRLLHAAARITRGGRRTWLRIAERWPWARELAAAFAQFAALPRPATC